MEKIKMSNLFQHLSPEYQEKVLKRWTPVLEAGKEIKDEYTRIATAMILENTQSDFDNSTKKLNEAMSSAAGGAFGSMANPLTDTTNDARVPSIVIPTVRRIFPELLAHEVVGVQAMSGPVGFAFAFRALYGAQGKGAGTMSGVELGYNHLDAGFSGASADMSGLNQSMWTAFAGSGTNTYGGTYYPNGAGATLANSEFWAIGTDMPQAAFRMEKGVVEAKTRKLAATWSLELAEDMEKMQGINVDSEMVNILSYEIQQEIDRQLLTDMVAAAINGSRTSTWSPVSADGRTQMERIGTLYTHVLDKANDVAYQTRRGQANWAITSPKVCALLERLGDFQFWGDGVAKVDTNSVGVAKVGTLRQSGIKLFRDTFAGGNYILLGYKGANPYDSGVVYCPYIPVQLMRSIGQNDFTPRLGARTRYGVLNNVFGADLYYHFIKIDSLTTTALAADGGRVFMY